MWHEDHSSLISPRDMVRERARRSDDDDLGSSSRASLLPNYRSEERKEHNEPEKR